MLIYIMHLDKIYISRLLNDGSVKYIISDYDNYNNKRTLVSAELRDGKWYIFDNENVKIEYSGKRVSNIELNIYNFYQLVILGTEKINLYVMPLYDSSFFQKELIGDSTIVCGSDSKTDIIYNLGISPKQLELDYKEGIYYFKNLDPKFPVYVNQIRQDNGFLKNFDTLFIMGLKIIICGNKLIINNPNNTVYIYSNKFRDVNDNCLIADYNTEVRTFNDFYADTDYYFKSPVFKSDIKDFEVVITDPPSKQQRDKSSVLMTVVPTFLMTFSSVIMTFSTLQRYNSGQTSREEMLSSLVMCVGMVVGGVLWPFVDRIYNNIRIVSSNAKRSRNYHKYLKGKSKLFEDAIREQKMTLLTNYVSLSECQRIIEMRTAELFNRDIDGKDFLNVRLGIGNIELKTNISYTKPDYTPEHDGLIDDIDKLIEKNKYIEDAPFVFSLRDNNSTAFIMNDRSLYNDYMMGIILQLITFHSYFDLKLVVLTSDDFSEISFLRESNHCWNNDHTFRYFASNLEDGQKISSTLEREFKSRIAKDDKNSADTPYYLIISDSIDKYRSLNLINDIIDNEEQVGFGLLMYDMKISNIPNGCTNFVSVTRNDINVFQTNVNSNQHMQFKPEFVSEYRVNVDYCSRLISNIPLKDVSNESNNLPDSIGFLQMYNVGNVDQLNSLSRWDNSSTSNSLSVPVGVDSHGNLVSLDLHEKSHGPHGLIAGMTGSGKSEFIVTYILSLAVNYRPDEVQFVLIDYKGGGLAGAFENRKTGIKLPHLVGTITNLDKSEMNRTLVSIKSELQRRQRMFNEAKEKLDTGNIDIYKYQKLHRDGILEQPLSHLFIICDEFAELKAQQPDFMDELVSAARIGRSLGIHLILATQKPSGVVDEQIWSNSKFKVCCKVQTVDDSNEMIKRPDAAYLKESGRFYLQVGYDEYFILGQSGYSGLPYNPTETVTSKIDNTISFISNTGEVYRSVGNKDNTAIKKRQDLGEELINILKYLIGIADSKQFKYQQLWLDNIPKVIYYDYLVKKYNVKANLYDIEPIIGEYDDPKGQRQGYVSLPITRGGNTYIAGISGSGKSTLLTTLIYSSIINHNCEEVNFYIIDLGAEKLKKFQNAPQVGDVLTIADTDKINYLFYMLENEKLKRQKYYSVRGGDFISDVKQKKCVFPNIVVVIYDIEVFKEAFEDLYDEKFGSFTRNCSKFGINFVVTGTTTTSLGYIAENNFPQKIMLNMLDSTDYSMFFDSPPIPNKNPGRGLIQMDEAYEFQVPLIFDEINEPQNLAYVLNQLDKFLVKKVKPVPIVPQEVKFADIENDINALDETPLGINIVTAQTGYFNFDKGITVVSSSNTLNSIGFFNSFIKIMEKTHNTKLIVLNALKDFNIEVPDGVKCYSTGFKDIVSVLFKNVQKYNNGENSDTKFIIVILGYKVLNSHVNGLKEEDSNVKSISDLIFAAKENDNFRFILYDSVASFSAIRNGDISTLVDSSTGIWIGREFDSQDCIEAPNSYLDDTKLTNDTVVIVKNGKAQFVKFAK